MKKNNKKVNFLKIAKIILFTVILTIYPISNIYAKYISKDGASQNATVAKFDVSESFVAEETFPVSIRPGEQVNREILINNNSDVAIKLTISVENVTNNLPLSFAGVNQEILPNTEQKVTVGVIWDKNEKSPDYAEMVDVIKLVIRAEQID